MRRGLTVLALVTLGVVLAFGFTLNNFLAISRPVDGDVLVVEGWIRHSAALTEAADEFKRGRYRWLVTVGDSVDAAGAAGRLRALGVDPSLIVVLPVAHVRLHQTYASALTLKSWLAKSSSETRGLNVFTLGAHARKSLVLFQRALGPELHVGVIAGEEDSFDPERWWLSARGTYVILRKALGYLYAVVWPLPTSLPTIEG